ncbi:hypothetical protein HO173_012242 [Letharia columbiana]|uniref:Uncharacterized protein n=1 Tax=Letharia columbiana TaxID=112416 RepID=A0A8H6CQ10_9LECA|nr:uncharacterized protein HO173_012242 [Letharia columbiana]KAF6227502.1 hypothetical protein HO173_012242 [Letharia columbiana]
MVVLSPTRSHLDTMEIYQSLTNTPQMFVSPADTLKDKGPSEVPQDVPPATTSEDLEIGDERNEDPPEFDAEAAAEALDDLVHDRDLPPEERGLKRALDFCERHNWTGDEAPRPEGLNGERERKKAAKKRGKSREEDLLVRVVDTVKDKDFEARMSSSEDEEADDESASQGDASQGDDEPGLALGNGRKPKTSKLKSNKRKKADGSEGADEKPRKSPKTTTKSKTGPSSQMKPAIPETTSPRLDHPLRRSQQYQKQRVT